jgi:hypothetical protein
MRPSSAALTPKPFSAPERDGPGQRGGPFSYRPAGAYFPVSCGVVPSSPFC